MKTEEIFQHLKKQTDIKVFLDAHQHTFNSAEFVAHLRQLMHDKNYNASDIIQHTQLSKSFVYKLLNGERSISRDRLLQMTLYMQCSIEETNDLIKYAGLPTLYAKKERDCILIYSIINGHNLLTTDTLLLDNQLQPLQNVF